MLEAFGGIFLELWLPVSSHDQEVENNQTAQMANTPQKLPICDKNNSNTPKWLKLVFKIMAQTQAQDKNAVQ